MLKLVNCQAAERFAGAACWKDMARSRDKITGDNGRKIAEENGACCVDGCRTLFVILRHQGGVLRGTIASQSALLVFRIPPKRIWRFSRGLRLDESSVSVFRVES